MKRTKRTMTTLALATALLGPQLAAAQAPPPPGPGGFAKKEGLWGYAIGRLLGRGLKNRVKNYEGLDWDRLTEGFELGVYGRPVEAAKTKTVGYLLGHWIGVSNRRKLLAYLPFVSGPEMARGFTDGLQGRSKITEGQGEEAIFDLQEAMVKTMPPKQRANQLKRVKVARERARKKRAAREQRVAAGAAFREQYLAKHKDAKTTASGLIYRIITPGKGPLPKPTQSVKVHYEGKLIDGSLFDSSRKRKTAVWFGVTHGIPGWVEAIQMMNAGAKWELVIPPELAYDQNSAGRIKPGSTLVFEVELLEIGQRPKAPTPPKK